jgi:glyceraldehyde-3-phosphate dehydrogenase/erythrose-4-phosphate dehydrogenase
MVYKVGINGFGRIGRQVFKAVTEGGFGDLF